MPTFDYNVDIPFATHNPSNDQPLMQVNTNSTNSIINVDHYSFKNPLGGTHKQVTFSAENAQGAQVDPASVLYTQQGDLSTKAELLFRNQNGIALGSLIKAYVVFSKTAGNAVTVLNKFNVVNVTFNAGNDFKIQLDTANLTIGNTFGILANQKSHVNGLTWTYADPNITVTTTAGSDTITLIVLQF